MFDHSYRTLIEEVLDDRRNSGLPPFGHLAILHADSTSAKTASTFLSRVVDTIASEAKAVSLIGPVPAYPARRANRHRFQLILKSGTRKPLHETLEIISTMLETRATDSSLRWHIDVDPIDGF